MLDRKVDRSRDEAKTMRVVMQPERASAIVAASDRDDWSQFDAHELRRTIGAEATLALSGLLSLAGEKLRRPG